jgi:hypothetical protein
MAPLWKVLVISLVGYTIYLHRKLLYLTDAAYRLAHEAEFPSVDDPRRSLHDTQWGGHVITTMNVMMAVVIVLAVLTVGRDLIRFFANRPPPSAEGPPPDPPAPPVEPAGPR